MPYFKSADEKELSLFRANFSESQIGREKLYLEKSKLLENVGPKEFTSFLIKSLKYRELPAIEGLTTQEIKDLQPKTKEYQKLRRKSHNLLFLAGLLFIGGWFFSAFILFIANVMFFRLTDLPMISIFIFAVYGWILMWAPPLAAGISYRIKATQLSSLRIKGVKVDLNTEFPRISWEYPHTVSPFKPSAENERLTCSNCLGSGRANYLFKCKECDGTWYHTVDISVHYGGPMDEGSCSSTESHSEECPICHGSGKVPKLCVCEACKGSGSWIKNTIINDYNAFATKLNEEISQFIQKTASKEPEVTLALREINRKIDLWNENFQLMKKK